MTFLLMGVILIREIKKQLQQVSFGLSRFKDRIGDNLEHCRNSTADENHGAQSEGGVVGAFSFLDESFVAVDGTYDDAIQRQGFGQRA